MFREDQVRAIAAHDGDVTGAFGGQVVFGAIIPRVRDNQPALGLVDLDLDGRQVVGKACVMVTFSDDAAATAGFAAPAEMSDYLDKLRMNPKLGMVGVFVLEPGPGMATVLSVSGIRPITDDELGAATKAATQQAITWLDLKGIKPKMSSDELTELMRGDDYDGIDQPFPTR